MSKFNVSVRLQKSIEKISAKVESYSELAQEERAKYCREHGLIEFL